MLSNDESHLTTSESNLGTNQSNIMIQHDVVEQKKPQHITFEHQINESKQKKQKQILENLISKSQKDSELQIEKIVEERIKEKLEEVNKIEINELNQYDESIISLSINNDDLREIRNLSSKDGCSISNYVGWLVRRGVTESRKQHHVGSLCRLDGRPIRIDQLEKFKGIASYLENLNTFPQIRLPNVKKAIIDTLGPQDQRTQATYEKIIVNWCKTALGTKLGYYEDVNFSTFKHTVLEKIAETEAKRQTR